MKSNSNLEGNFDSIYQAYEDEVFRVCLYYVKDESTARDLAHQTFVKFFERVEIVSRTNIKAYLLTAARNMSYNYLRDAKREVQSDEIEVEASKKEYATESLEEAYFRREQRKREIAFGAEIFNEMRESHQTWYEPLYMSLALGKTYDEIAEELGVSKEVLYSRIHRAKEWIQKKYGAKFDDIMT